MQDLKLGCASSSVSPATPLAYDSRLCPKLGAKPPTPQSARALAAMYGLGKVNRAMGYDPRDFGPGHSNTEEWFLAAQPSTVLAKTVQPTGSLHQRIWRIHYLLSLQTP